MINLPPKKLRSGMVTGQGIYNSQGVTLLTKGTELDEKYIKKLQRLELSSLNVTSLNPELKIQPPDDLIQEKTRMQVIYRLIDIFDEVKSTGRFNMEALTDIAEKIIADLVSRQKNLVQLTDIRLHDSYTFVHSVNVSVLASMLGIACGCTEAEILDITLGGLLHDIGKIYIPQDVLNKPGKLTAAEMNKVRKHPEIGERKLREANAFSLSVIKIANQHHEHMDGKGYPSQLTDKRIHRFARMVAIADVYDALTSTRPYKKAYKPSIAYKIMTKFCQGQFDPELLCRFFDNVAIYPVGTVLKTTLGYAIVKQIEFEHTRTPVIYIFASKRGKPIFPPRKINLSNYKDSYIESIVDSNDLSMLVSQVGFDPAQYLINEEKENSSIVKEEQIE
ncbi:MAG: HD-GYP domain-containing protein [Selenomonadaceae bacterium]